MPGPDLHYAANGAALLTVSELHDLPEYSMSLPTGTTEGKRWRCARRWWRNADSDEWLLGEYGTPYPEGHEFHGDIPISWTPILVTNVARTWPAGVFCPLRPIAVTH